MKRFLFLLIITSAACVFSAFAQSTDAPEMETLDFDWCSISVPETVPADGPFEGAIRIKADVIESDSELKVDFHKFVSANRVSGIESGPSVNLKAGEPAEVPFSLKQIPADASAIHVVVYTLPVGATTFKEASHKADAGARVDRSGANIPAERPSANIDLEQSWKSDAVQGDYYTYLVEKFKSQGYKPEFALAPSESAFAEKFALRGDMQDRVEITPIEISPDADTPFSQVFRIKTDDEAKGDKWKIIFGLSQINYPLKKGDHLLFLTWLRGVERPDAGPIKYFMWSAERDTDKRLGHAIGVIPYGNPDDAWQPLYVHLTVPDDKPDGNWYIEFHLNGEGAQTFEMGGMALLDFGEQNPEKDFITPVRIDWEYQGRESDASWREEAKARIEKHRMSDLEIRVIDQDGKPVADAEVSIQQQKHDFPWGIVFNPREWPGAEAPREDKFEFTRDYLNQVTYVQFDWRGWRGLWKEVNTPPYLVKGMKQAVDQGFSVHAHALIWHKYGFAPFTREDSRDKILETIRSHWEEVLTMPGIQGKFRSIDVVNHPISYGEIWRDHGIDLMVKEFEWADELAPDSILYINEGGHSGDSQFDQYIELIDQLLTDGAPIDGVGSMSHFKLNHLVGMDKLLEGFERIDALGEKHERPLAIKITEFDVDTFDLSDVERAELQADYFRDFMTLAFSHPSVESFTFWSLWGHDFPSQSIFNKDGSDRPAATVLKKLLREDWWTSMTDQTDAEGRMSARVFRGEHDVTVRFGEKSQEQRVVVDKGSSEITVQLR